MREIKFRGYAIDEMMKSQWIYGYGVYPIEFSEDYAKKIGRKKDVYLFTENGEFRVSEKSIGQYTGLKDKNGVEIYEGDVLSGWIASHWQSGEDRFKKVVKYDAKTASYNFPAMEVRYGDLRVIGNIYENADLLEVSK